MTRAAMATMTRRPDLTLTRTYLEGCLLLLLTESPTHGYDLLDRLAGLGLGDLDSGAVYRALRALNDAGLVTSWWEQSSSGPARRRYRVTDAGATSLARRASQAAATSTFLDSFVARHRRVQQRAAGATPAPAYAGAAAGEGAA